jgi:AAA domain/Bifunctional DNA primase/polymerase, N-terminal
MTSIIQAKKLQGVETAQHEYRRLQNGNPDELTVRRTVINILEKYGAKRISDLSEADCELVSRKLRRVLALHLATVSRIIPIPKNCKATKLTDWPKLATSDPKIIDGWIDRYQGCNWGSVTNAIDVDSKDPKEGRQRGTDTWAKLTAENGEPQTLKTITPTNGFHYIITDKLPNSVGAIGDGIDTRGEGIGYVVSAGSYVVANGKDIRETGFYRAVAGPIISVPWAVARLGSRRADADDAGERGLAAVTELDTEGAIEQAIDLLQSYATAERETGQNGKQIGGPAFQGEGGDDWTVQVANYVGDLGVSQEMCSALMYEHFNPACVPPWLGDAEEGDDKDRLSYKVASAYKSRQKPPGSDSAEADFADDPIEDDDDLVREEKRRRLPKSLSLRELMTGEFPRTSYTVGGLVMQDIVNMFYGNGGTGKTTIAIQMGVAVAAGKRLFERDTIKGPVLLVLAEDAAGEIKPRVAGSIKDLGIKDPDELDCEVWALPGEEISVARINEEGKTILLPFYYELEKKLTAKPGLFVVLDSLADIAQMGEAHRLPVNAFFKKVLGGLAIKYKATILVLAILVLAHPSKASMADGSYYSGSTAYRNAVRNMIVIKDIKGTSFRSLERLKNNYANDRERITVAWADNIFVTPQNAVIADSEQGRYRAVLNCIRDMIANGDNVAKTNQASGQTPKDVANAVNALGVVTVDADSLRAAAPQPTQRLNQDRESARQPTCCRRRCQDTAIAISFAKSSKDGHGSRMHASHLDYDCGLGLVPRLFAFDHGQRGIDSDLRHSAVWQTRGGLELKQGRVDEVHGDAAKGGLEPVEPCLVITVRRKRLGSVAVDPLQFHSDGLFPDPRWPFAVVLS